MSNHVEVTPEQLTAMFAQAIHASVQVRATHTPADWAHDLTHLMANALAYIRPEDREAALADVMGALRELIPGYEQAIIMAQYGKGGRA